MTPVTIIREAEADGVKLILSPAGTIKATGDGVAVNRWLAAIREHKAEIIDVLRVGAGDTATASRWWLTHYPDRDPVEVSCTPPATHADILERHPDAVAAEPFTPTIRQTSPPLTASEETAIRAWFTSIGEDDPATIADTLAQCQADSVGRAYLLKESAHAQHNSTAPLANQWISCGACKHFRRIAIHPHLGHCSRGKPEGTAGLWDSTVRWCAEGAAS